MSTFAFIFIAVISLIDIYVFRGMKILSPNKNWAWYLYIASSIFTYAVLIQYYFAGKESVYLSSKIFLFGIAQTLIITKIVLLPFVLVTDIMKGINWLGHSIQSTPNPLFSLGRYKFVMRIAVVFGAFFFGAFLYGMAYGAYQLTKQKITVAIPDLPEELEGLKIVQISDSHLGSFASLHPIQKTVQAINEENPDLFFFTGDLVNDKAIESEPYIPIIKEIKARYGKYSILGNHDYGMYVNWAAPGDRLKNLAQLVANQKAMDWDLLLNENRTIQINGKSISIIGVEYWGKSARWGQFGDLDKALIGSDSSDLKLLLTHDPSHWDMIVSQNEKYKDIPLSMAGHTHGFQFGVEIPGIKWSPSKMIYPRWAGLYKEDNQYLYVNRGLGFLGYPGRVGIYPEITVITLTRSNDNGTPSNL